MLAAVPRPDDRAYLPGQMVPISGVYNVIHNYHRRQHQVIAIRGDEFPSCRTCGNDVRFYVAKVYPHMTHDFDLAGPVLLRRAKAAGKSDG